MNNNCYTVIYHKQKGFTLIELLVYMAVLTIFITGAIQFAWNSIGAGVKSTTQQEVLHNLRFATNRIAYEIRNATDVTQVNGSQLVLQSSDANRNPTEFNVNTGRLTIGYDNDPDCPTTTPCPLTSNDVTVSSLTFTEILNGSVRSIQITLIIAHNNSSGKSEWDFQQSYTTTVKLRQ